MIKKEKKKDVKSTLNFKTVKNLKLKKPKDTSGDNKTIIDIKSEETVNV